MKRLDVDHSAAVVGAYKALTLLPLRHLSHISSEDAFPPKTWAQFYRVYFGTLVVCVLHAVVSCLGTAAAEILEMRFASSNSYGGGCLRLVAYLFGGCFLFCCEEA